MPEVDVPEGKQALGSCPGSWHLVRSLKQLQLLLVMALGCLLAKSSTTPSHTPSWHVEYVPHTPAELCVLPCCASTGNGTGIVWDQQGHVSGALNPFAEHVCAEVPQVQHLQQHPQLAGRV